MSRFPDAVLLLLLVVPPARAQYVGSKACLACHPDKFEMQSKTGHAHALGLAPPGSPGHWAFGAGAKAITYVSQLDQGDEMRKTGAAQPSADEIAEMASRDQHQHHCQGGQGHQGQGRGVLNFKLRAPVTLQ